MSLSRTIRNHTLLPFCPQKVYINPLPAPLPLSTPHSHYSSPETPNATHQEEKKKNVRSNLRRPLLLPPGHRGHPVPPQVRLAAALLYDRRRRRALQELCRQAALGFWPRGRGQGEEQRAQEVRVRKRHECPYGMNAWGTNGAGNQVRKV